MAAGDSFELLSLYQRGESEAAAVIFDRYVERLVALARSRMSGKLRRRVDPEDVVQSAFRSFFLHARAGVFELHEAGDLWRLLAQIALHKLYSQSARHHAKRRNVTRDDGSEGLVAARSPEPSAVEMVALVEQLHLVLGRLDLEQSTVLVEILRGRSAEAIAGSMQKSARTIRRYLAEARAKIEQELHVKQTAISVPDTWMNAAVGRAPSVSAMDYVLERMLGSGGMGKVYRARQRATGQIVAIKALRKRRQCDSRAVEQFVQEAKILGTLEHPHIVGVRGLGRFPGGGLFLVLDFVDGTNLEDRLQRERFSGREALSVIRHVAEAVGYLHDRGIVHADLKPANVLMDATGRALVTDFGFARIVDADSARRRATVGGTKGYMAPEVCRGGQTPTFAADLYGLGALLRALVMGSPPNGLAAADDVGGDWELIAPICERCMFDDPKDRFCGVPQFLVTVERAVRAAGGKWEV
jgi:DNA-directed RNA polymerase specialized sigma24 family protein/predicted Ser/Thr protein kinase